MACKIDEDAYISYEVHMYNSLAVAEGRRSIEDLINAVQFDELPPIKKLNDRIKLLGYDTFEIHKIETTEARYAVE